MSPTPEATRMVLVLVATVLIAWELYCLWWGKIEATISHVLNTANEWHPELGCLVFLLVGHIFLGLRR